MRCCTLILWTGLLLSPLSTKGQVIACSSMQGHWKYTYDNTEYDLSQDGSGNITGTYIDPLCIGHTPPIAGTTSGGQFTFTISDLTQCPGDYNSWTTFTGYIGEPGCNYVYGNWTNSFGNSGGFGQSEPYPSSGPMFTKAVDVPASETSVHGPAASWDKINGGAPWTQTFAPNSPPGEFEARGVYEFVGGTGSDSCWFKQSKFSPFTTISRPGYGWIVTSKNTWGSDFIGWTLAAVQYYRAQKKAPCGTRFYQQAVIDAAYSPDNPSSYSGPYTDESGNTFYGVSYEVNTLGGDITATAVTSVRNGQVATNTTWK